MASDQDERLQRAGERGQAIRFAIKRSPWWRPLLALFGATAARAYLDVDRERLVARFGWYRLEVPRAQVATVEPVRWRW